MNIVEFDERVITDDERWFKYLDIYQGLDYESVSFRPIIISFVGLEWSSHFTKLGLRGRYTHFCVFLLLALVDQYSLFLPNCFQ